MLDAGSTWTCVCAARVRVPRGVAERDIVAILSGGCLLIVYRRWCKIRGAVLREARLWLKGGQFGFGGVGEVESVQLGISSDAVRIREVLVAYKNPKRRSGGEEVSLFKFGSWLLLPPRHFYRACSVW